MNKQFRFLIYRRLPIWLLLILLPFQSVNSQSFCTTPFNSDLSDLNLAIRNMDEQGPFYIRIYVHVIRKSNGAGGQSVPDVYQALSYLDLDFNPHNIFFIWDCNIDYIDSNYWYSNAHISIFSVNPHTDGIDIYLYPDGLYTPPIGGGEAGSILSNHFYIFGNNDEPPYGSIVKSHVISHEMGHCLALYHTQEDGTCEEYVTRVPEENANCDYCGDLCCDTPADPGMNNQVDQETCTWDELIYDENPDIEFVLPYDPDEHNNMSYSHPDCLEYFTQDQGQRMRNAITTESILQACIVPNCDITITDPDVIWNSPIEVKGNLVIEDGAKLTITNIVSFYPNSSVIVKVGGKLIINGGTLTNVNDECHGYRMWKGVQVWGNKYAHQYPDSHGHFQQGYIELINNANIQNAICAVDLWRPGEYFTTGGIIKATNSNFNNNARSVHALFYKNFHPVNGRETDYRASFVNCTFNINANYLATESFYKHIDLACVKGFSFSACNFSLAQSVDGVAVYNHAIASYSSGFKVTGQCTSLMYPCTNYNPSAFDGFHFAIYASNDYLTPYTFNISRSNFTNNIYGIKALAVKNETVLFSSFNIGYNNTTACSSASGYGIYLNLSSGFAIEENFFSKMTGAPQSLYTGISTNNTYSMDEIYQNSFSGLSYGNYASGTNIAELDYYGLAYYCNHNSNNYIDFYAPIQNTFALQSFQGDPQYPAGNTFSTNATMHFFSGIPTMVEYYYDENITDQTPNPQKLDGVVAFPVNTTNLCLTHYGNNAIINTIVLNDQDILDREQEFILALSNYDNVKYLYNSLKDGGSTEQKLIDIESANPQDMWTLRSELLGDSPHLSEVVLKKVADKTDVFSESTIFDILAANPDELKKEDLIKYLEDKENPLPTYMIDILKQVAVGTTYKTALLQEMSRYYRLKTRAANDIIRSILNDTIIDYNALRNWYDNLGGIEADKQIIATYLHENNYESALSLASIFPQLYNLQGEDLVENERMVQIIQLYQSLYNSGRVVAQLNNTEKSFLEVIAASSRGTSGAIAEGILSYFYGEVFVDCIEEIGGSSAYKSGKISPELLAKIYKMEICVKPNPANSWAAFDYKLPEDVSLAFLEITDLFGKTVAKIELNQSQGQKLIDTRTFSPGIYFYTFKVDSKHLTGKLSIVK